MVRRKLNAGNNINYDSPIVDVEAKYIFAGLNLTGVDFIGLGAWDLRFGLDKVKNQARGSVADIVCANIDGFLPYLRFTRDAGRLKILVTSVFDPELLGVYKIEGVKAKDPSRAIRKLQREISHDIFIVITHARGERNQEILAGCSGIDLVIDGEKGRSNTRSESLLGIPVVSNNLGGKYVAYVDILKDRSGIDQVSSPTMIRASSKTVSADPQVAILVSQYEEERRLYILKEQKKREKARLQKRSATNIYLGSGWCGSCHGEIEKVWQQTRHAKAISSLTRKGRDNDPECLRCHVTGLNDEKAVGGFVAISDGKMAGVQCEACHGPGGRHAPSPTQVKMHPVNEKSCRVCHNEETDPAFDFNNDLKLIEHGKMPGKDN